MSVAPWFQTYTGKGVSLVDPDPETISLYDICVSLARQPRYNGHSQIPFSVAQHTCLADDLAPPDAGPIQHLHILLHDAPEYGTGDIIAPMKAAIHTVMTAFGAEGFDPVALIDDRLLTAIYLAAGMPSRAPDDDTLVAEVDEGALALEHMWHLGADAAPWALLPIPVVGQAVSRLYGVSWTEHKAKSELEGRVRRWLADTTLCPLPGFLG